MEKADGQGFLFLDDLLMSAFESVRLDEVQAYWDARPCNVRHSTQPVGTRAYFDEVEARKYRVEPHIPSFADFARWKGKRVLEIGCGIGTDTINFARAGAKVTAVDLSPKSLEIARARADVFGLSDRIRFYCANAEELSTIVPVERYDLRLLVRSHPSQSPPRPNSCAVAQLLGARRNSQADGLSPPLLESRMDRSWGRSWQILANGPIDCAVFGSADGLPGHLYLQSR